jgi:hypothetical protein
MANNNHTEWYIQVIDTRTGKPVDDDLGTVQVLNAGLPSEATVYSGRNDTVAATNPLTLRDGAARFYTEDSVLTVDLSVVSKGMGKFLRGFTPSDHNVQIDLDGQSTIVTIYGATTASEVDTGVVVEGPTRVIHAWLDCVTAAGSSALMDVGLSNPNDNNSVIDGTDINITGQTAVFVTPTANPGNSKVVAGTTANVTYLAGDATDGAGTGYICLQVGRSPA